jgi:hypothetical protein
LDFLAGKVQQLNKENATSYFPHLFEENQSIQKENQQKIQIASFIDHTF